MDHKVSCLSQSNYRAGLIELWEMVYDVYSYLYSTSV